MPTTRHIFRPLILALATLALLAATAQALTPIKLPALDVTSGSLTASGFRLHVVVPEMRAVVRDQGRHARSALLRFSFRQPSKDTKPLGSGEIRRQIGLKLRAGDPCNLLYVMWREFPAHAIVVSVKRNPGQTTSAQCGNRGYTDIGTVPLPTSPTVADHATHRLEARTRAHADGSMNVTVVADRKTVFAQRIPATLAGGLRGPVGVRSDNGEYRLELSSIR